MDQTAQYENSDFIIALSVFLFFCTSGFNHYRKRFGFNYYISV